VRNPKMPKYTYKCYGCFESFDVVHGILEEQSACPLCFNHVVKRVPQMPYLREKTPPKGDKVGDEVNRTIEENRELLRDEKKKRMEYKDGS
jgi:hypothetical protein